MNYFKRWRTPNQGSFIHTWAANENPIAHFRKFTFIFSSTDKNSTCHLLSTPEAQQSSQRVGWVLVLPSRVLHCCIEYTATAYQVRKLIKSRNRIRPSILLLILQINPKGRCSHPHLTTGKWRLSVTKQLTQHPEVDRCQSTQGPKIHVILTPCPDKTIMDLADDERAKETLLWKCFPFPFPRGSSALPEKKHKPSEDRPRSH